jgi:hypothetical protein
MRLLLRRKESKVGIFWSWVQTANSEVDSFTCGSTQQDHQFSSELAETRTFSAFSG